MNEQQSIALVEEQEIINFVQGRIRIFVQNRELMLPPNYSAENALKSAWLMLQTTEDKNHQPVLKVCTQSSIATALLDMVIQGLNPRKEQCYFIAHGKQLVCRKSYHGARAITIRMCGAKDVNAQVVWGNDEFEYEIERGVKKVTTHRQKLENVGKNPKAAYCVILLPDDLVYTDIMTIEQIKQSWKKSHLYKDENSKSFHNEYPEEAIKRTIIGRACKKYINSSSDNHLLLESFNRADEIADQSEIEQEMLENANKKFIDTQPESENVDPKTGECLNEDLDQSEPQPQQSESELAGVGGGNGGNGEGKRGPGF